LHSPKIHFAWVDAWLFSIPVPEFDDDYGWQI
jgi:hypothetical protein